MHSSTMSQPRSPQATPSAVGAALKPMRRLPIADRALVLDAEVLAPAAVDAVEFQQMGGGRRAAFDLVHVHDVEAVIRRADRPLAGTCRPLPRAAPGGRSGPCR